MTPTWYDTLCYIFMCWLLWLPVNSPHKGQWRGALMFSLICAWINGWVNNCEAGVWRRHRAHYDVTVMKKSERDNSEIRLFYESEFDIVENVKSHNVTAWKCFPHWPFVRRIHTTTTCSCLELKSHRFFAVLIVKYWNIFCSIYDERHSFIFSGVII